MSGKKFIKQKYATALLIMGLFLISFGENGALGESTSSVTSSEPTSTVTSSEPTITATSSEPTSTATSSEPTSTATSSEPISTVTSSEPTSTATPSESTSTATPSESTSTATPSESTSTATPSESTSTATPSESTSTATPSESTSTATPSESTSTATPSESTSTATPSESTSTATPSESTSTATPSESTSTATPSESTSTATPSESTSTATPSESTSTATPSESTSTATPSESTSTATPSESTSTATPSESTSTATPSESTSIATPSESTSTATPSESTSTTTPSESTSTATPSESTSTATPSESTSTATPSESTSTATHSESTSTVTHSESTSTATHSESTSTATHSESTSTATHSESTSTATHSESTSTVTHSESTSTVTHSQSSTSTATHSESTSTATSSESTSTATPSQSTSSATPSESTSTATPSESTSTATPSESTSTATPSESTSSATPSESTSTATPSESTSTATPSESTSTVTPSESTNTATPSESTSTATPSESTSTATPNESSSTATPSESTSTATPSESTSSATPSESTSSATPSESTSSATPSESTSSATPSESTSSATSSESSSTATSSESSSTATPSESTSSATPSESTSTATPSEPTSTATPSESTSTATPSESTSTATPSESTRTATPSESTSTVTPSESTSTATPSESTSTATPSESSSTATPSESTSTATPSESSSTATPSESTSTVSSTGTTSTVSSTSTTPSSTSTTSTVSSTSTTPSSTSTTSTVSSTSTTPSSTSTTSTVSSTSTTPCNTSTTSTVSSTSTTPISTSTTSTVSSTSTTPSSTSTTSTVSSTSSTPSSTSTTSTVSSTSTTPSSTSTTEAPETCGLYNGNCQHGCEDVEHGVQCSCDDYFILQTNGKTCAASCATNPCQHGGTCTTDSTASEHICACVIGYTGDKCETATCDGNPCLNGGTCSVENNQHTCSCTAGFKGKNCQIKVATLPFPYGLDAGHETIDMDKPNECYRVTDLPCPIKVKDIYRDRFFICENGIVTFNGIYKGNAVPVSEYEQYHFLTRDVVAPYFSDIVLSEGASIHYRLYTEDEIITDGSVNDPLTAILEDAGYDAMEKFMLLVVTWENVTEYGQSPDLTSTFQLIIVSDGMLRTEAFFAYLDGGMMFATSENLIGYRFYDTGVTDPVSKYTNLGRSGFVWLSLNPGFDDTISDCMSCRRWVKQQTNGLAELQTNWNQMATCPCIQDTIPLTGQFNKLKDRFSPSPSSTCYSIVAERRRGNQGSTCCYSKADNSYISTLPNVGIRTQYNPFRKKKRNFYSTELDQRAVCCSVSVELCDLFHTVRPSNIDCSINSTVAVGGGTGDPHILTPDGKEFTFNGHGEYTLLKFTTAIVDFKLQGRTAAYRNDDDEDVGATVFSAFAAADEADGSKFQIEMSSNSASLLVSVNGQLLSSENMNEEDFVETYDDITLSKPNNDTLDVFFSNAGVKISVGLRFKFLTVSLTVPIEYNGLPRGLFGNVNGNPDDDFITPDEEILQKNISDREIFSYGQKWMVSGAESIFEYPNGATYLNYQDLDATVNFLDEALPEDVTDAEEFCGIGNMPCIFDRVYTGREDIAASTKVEVEKQNDTREILANEAPTVVLHDSTGGPIHVNLKEIYTVTVRGHDDGQITYERISGNDVNITAGTSDELKNVVFKIGEESDSPISITVVDNKQVSAPALVLNIILCTGCSGNGDCDFSRTRPSLNGNFITALCVCNEFYEGDNCDTNFDGCEGNPCSRDRNCTDNDVDVHKSTGKAYNCSDCPDGFVVNSDDVCDDINECQSDEPCSDLCVNTVGSYLCTCKTGRRTINETTCEDINECEEGTHNCAHICTNVNEGFNCSCYDGFVYENGVCNQTIIENDPCDALNCSADLGGCRKVDNEDPACFCNNGYHVNGTECSDDNECDIQACSQVCENTVGSYKCSCFTGYQLNADRASCDECPAGSWGDGCTEECSCSSQGSERCDNVKGCICNAGWKGTVCSENVNECSNASICVDANKYCEDTVGSYQCLCRDGYQKNTTTDTCIDFDECTDPDLDICEQECVNTVGSFTCACESGYNVDPSNRASCTDIDECRLGSSGCQQDCKNTIGSYNCLCYFGYALNDDLKTCTKMSVEDTCSSVGLQCTGFCITNETSAFCACGPGFVLADDDKMTCIDINECNDEVTNNCQRPDTCTNIDGGYKCSCVPGEFLQNDGRNCTACDAYHYGDNCALECNCGVGSETCDPVSGCQCKDGWLGKHCDEDINECSNETICADNMVCVNSPGTFSCNCKDGYFNNSIGECENINECDNPQDNVCAQICTDTVGSYKCSCRGGFQATGTDCEDIDECIGQSQCDQVCINTVGGYRCSCNKGFYLNSDDRRTCIPDSECQDQTKCDTNTSYCLSNDGNDECICKKGYVYNATDTDICIDEDECDVNDNLCDQNCTNTIGAYYCRCEAGYKLAEDGRSCIVCDGWSYGTECAEICPCNIDNTASCDTVNGTCECKPGWTGTSCTEDIIECNYADLYDCADNSTCVNNQGSYSCRCDDGFLETGSGNCIECNQGLYGTGCSEVCECNMLNVVECGTVDGTCHCLSGWNGTTCDGDIDECSDNSICSEAHKSICGNTDGSYVCNCDQGFELDSSNNCIDINECQRGTHDCTQNCTNTDGSFNCSCNTGFSGTVNDCTKCTPGKYGTDCGLACSCNTSNTEDTECDNVDGTCHCKTGWQGETCEDDIDECTEDTYDCTDDNKSICDNTISSYVCLCDDGHELDSADNCIECSNFTYGNQCLNNCSCNIDNANGCNIENGTCICKPTWTGSTCDEDLNECASNTTNNCTGEFEGCHDLPDGNGYVCSCSIGYNRTEAGICEDYLLFLGITSSVTTTQLPDTRIAVIVTLELDFNLASSEDLTVGATYVVYEQELIVALIAIYNPGNVSTIQIIIHNIWPGSVNVNFSVIADKADSSTIAAKSLDIVSGDATVALFGTNTSALSMTVGGYEVDYTTDACYLARRIDYECDICVIVDGVPECSKKDTADLAMILGLCVGIFMFIIMVIIIIMIVVWCRRKNSPYVERKYRDYSGTNLNWRQHNLTQLPGKGDMNMIRSAFNPFFEDVDGSSESSGSTVLRRGVYLPSTTPQADYNVMDGDRRIYQRNVELLNDEGDRPIRLDGKFTIPRPAYDANVTSLHRGLAEEHRQRAQPPY